MVVLIKRIAPPPRNFILKLPRQQESQGGVSDRHGTFDRFVMESLVRLDCYDPKLREYLRKHKYPAIMEVGNGIVAVISA